MKASNFKSPLQGYKRIFRGGSWDFDAEDLDGVFVLRYRYFASYQNANLGLRIVCNGRRG